MKGGTGLNLQQIKYVAAIAKSGSFSKAAEELYVTEATISQQVKKLEQELETELFSRSTRKIALTDAGKLFVKRAVAVIAAYEKLERSMEQFSDAGGRVFHMGMTPAMEALGVSRFAVNFNKEHQDVEIRLFTAQAEHLGRALMERRIDLAVMKLPEKAIADFDAKKFRWKSLMSERMLLVAPEGTFANRAGEIPLCEIADFPVICETEGSAMYRCLAGYYEENGLPLRISLRTNYAESMFAAVEAGQGIAFATPSICRYYAERYRFCCVPITPDLENTVYAVCLKEKNLGRRGRSFLTALAQMLQTCGENEDSGSDMVPDLQK